MLKPRRSATYSNYITFDAAPLDSTAKRGVAHRRTRRTSRNPSCALGDRKLMARVFVSTAASASRRIDCRKLATACCCCCCCLLSLRFPSLLLSSAFPFLAHLRKGYATFTGFPPPPVLPLYIIPRFYYAFTTVRPSVRKCLEDITRVGRYSLSRSNYFPSKIARHAVDIVYSRSIDIPFALIVIQLFFFRF